MCNLPLHCYMFILYWLYRCVKHLKLGGPVHFYISLIDKTDQFHGGFYKVGMSQNPSQPDTEVQGALRHIIISDISLEMWENCLLKKSLLLVERY